MSLPLAESRSGLPIGIQLVAPYGREDLLFQVAGQLEQALPWSDRRPPVTVGRSA
jgi:amidase